MFERNLVCDLQDFELLLEAVELLQLRAMEGNTVSTWEACRDMAARLSCRVNDLSKESVS